MANNGYQKDYVDGAALTEAKLDTALQTLKPDLAQMTQATLGSTAGQFLRSTGSELAPDWGLPLDPKGPFAIRNYGIVVSAATGALTFRLKTKAGADPSPSEPVDISVSTNGATSATHRDMQVTGALSITVPSSATLGTFNTVASPVYLYAFAANTSTIRLAVSRDGGYDMNDQQSTSAISAASDSGAVLYSATVATAVVPRMLGYAQVARNSTIQWQTPTRCNIGQALSSGSMTSFSPTMTVQAGSVSTSVIRSYFRRLGRLVVFQWSATWTQATTATSYIELTLPFTADTGIVDSGGLFATGSALTNTGAGVGSIGAATISGLSPTILRTYKDPTRALTWPTGANQFSSGCIIYPGA